MYAARFFLATRWGVWRIDEMNRSYSDALVSYR
jgi:hypothetical protein